MDLFLNRHENCVLELEDIDDATRRRCDPETMQRSCAVSHTRLETIRDARKSINCGLALVGGPQKERREAAVRYGNGRSEQHEEIV
jgi:hypothetical protein